MVKNPSANAGDISDAGSTLGSGRSPGGGHDNPLQYSCLGNPMDRGAWRATVHGISKSGTQLSTHAFMFTRLLKKEMTQEQHRKERPCRMWGGRAVPLSVHSPQISHNPVLLGFLEASLRRFDGSAHWPSLRAQSAH